MCEPTLQIRSSTSQEDFYRVYVGIENGGGCYRYISNLVPYVSDSIALIIAYYNGSAFIEEALSSAFKQITPFNEIILVDDGSSVEEAQFVLGLANKYRFKYIKKINGGQGSARNAGCREAKSNYVCFLDQDDMLLPEHNCILVNQMKILPQPYGSVFGNFSLAQSNGDIVSRKYRPKGSIELDRNLYQFLKQDLYILPTASLICRTTFLSINGFDEQFRGYEDDDLSIRLFLGGYKQFFIDEEVYVWRMHKKQMSSSRIMLESRMKFIDKWLNYDYDKSIDVGTIRQLLFDRFKRAVLIDIIKAETKDAFFDAREIASALSNRFKKNQRMRDRMLLFVVCLLPQKILQNVLRITKMTRVHKLFRAS